ncbi:MAG: hypothetical protein SFZ23_15120 [Planctomycetota bacterium]|nr:hypothetical protein [Planctomycetota bacterium]
MHQPRVSRTGLAAAVVGLLALASCARVSPWEAALERGVDPAEPGVKYAMLSPQEAARNTSPVRVRSVPWERTDATMRALEAKIAASDIHPAEWSPERREDLKRELLRGLQVSEDPARVTILGRSVFRTTDVDASSEEELVALARRLDADTVVWSSRSLGSVDRIVQEPVTSYTSGTNWNRRYGDTRRRSESFSESTTTWIPVRVSMQEVGFIAYFLRTPSGPG